MSRPYSEDLRRRAVAAVAEGLSRRQAAEVFSVGASSVIRWAQRQEQTGSVSARPMGGSRGTRIRGADREGLLGRVKGKPDLTFEGVRRGVAGHRGLKG